jgi:hypothetical protein
METEMSPEARGKVLHLDVPIDADEELSALHGALLAARASELSQVRRRGDRLSFGYGSDSAREGMNAEVDHAERRWAMIDRLISALDEASARDARGE